VVIHALRKKRIFADSVRVLWLHLLAFSVSLDQIVADDLTVTFRAQARAGFIV
jgi:hypothetical protein